MAGHTGYLKTYQRAKMDFYWSGMKTDIKKWMRECEMCQTVKYNVLPTGLLQPLPIPEQAWTEISMDFIEGLPKSKVASVILVIVDKFTKYGHFMTLSHPYIARDVAQVFMDAVFKLNGLPKMLVSDRDPIFRSSFWKDLFEL
ncbi:hypothetical protein CIPAW_11G101300 [Carya illinoinensis]|uniref:Integrase catalytic domain-containing protein n=1 Tax=Carya illinoinensis TaxID=32201 RepID=A0A8T1P0T0_CARIL|nr:hypothetical protein CIPAW_11G101300 [Carya illinoinensis]